MEANKYLRSKYIVKYGVVRSVKQKPPLAHESLDQTEHRHRDLTRQVSSPDLVGWVSG